jgi:ABC-type polysaccharide/polyol phosphate export permease
MLALPGSFYPDVSSFLQSISLGILLGTPLLYEAVKIESGPLYWLQAANPLAGTIDVARSAVFGADTVFHVEAMGWVAGLLVSTICFLSIYRMVAPIILERN